MKSAASGHHLSLLKGADAYFPALIQAIDASQFEVRLETYIFNFHGSGQQVAQALVRAASRGVAVFLAMDGIGTPGLPAHWQEQFNQSGVAWQIFRPLGRFGMFLPSRWRRLHRKLCVVDGQQAFCGGINLLDDWFDPRHGDLDAPRFDFAVLVSGPLVQAVHAAMAQFWWRLQATQSARQIDLAGTWQALQQAAQNQRKPRDARPGGGATAELVLRDNVRNRTRIERAYRQAIGLARQEIVLANAYFLPGRKMRMALTHAARRGVRVRLLLQGRYEYWLQHAASRALYDQLLAAGVEIHEYHASFLHAKVAVVDGLWATVGSSNIDPLSLLLAREANVVVHDPAFSAELLGQLEQAMVQGAQRIDPIHHATRSLALRMVDRLALLAIRAILFMIGKRY